MPRTLRSQFLTATPVARTPIDPVPDAETRQNLHCGAASALLTNADIKTAIAPHLVTEPIMSPSTGKK
jgi:hypothetical protein